MRSRISARALAMLAGAGVTLLPALAARPAGASTSATASATRTAVAVPPSPVQPLGVPGGWHLIFDDEFGGNHLDVAKWNYGAKDNRYRGPLNAGETENYSPREVHVGGGALTLDDVAVPNRICSTDSYNPGCISQPILSGAINTYGKFSFTYGFAEARVYTPGSPAVGIYNWPAFWLTGENLRWPMSGEIDTFEGLSGSAAFHFNYGTPAHVVYTGHAVPGDYVGWHIYGVDWLPGSVTFFYDGHEVGRLDQGITGLPMYVLLDLATGGSGGQTVTPSEMKVDYVRVWQR